LTRRNFTRTGEGPGWLTGRRPGCVATGASDLFVLSVIGSPALGKRLHERPQPSLIDVNMLDADMLVAAMTEPTERLHLTSAPVRIPPREP